MTRSRWSRSASGLWVQPSRRSLIQGASAGAAAWLMGCAGSADPGNGERVDAGGAANDASAAPTMPVDCVVRAEQTEGPFPNLDDELKRADIRAEPSDGAAKPGVPLRLVLRFGQVDGTMCRPVVGAVIDVWQCDALGVYSAYADAPGKKFLRGYQETDQSGTVEFVTIYPGSYRPRPVHIHFSARLNRQRAIRTADDGIFVSQVYFPLELSQEIFRQAPYSGGAPPTSNTAADVPWVLRMERDGAGWRGLLDVGLRMPLA
jgi:protocatechuate 3,4-dioxygenase beta subunit